MAIVGAFDQGLNPGAGRGPTMGSGSMTPDSTTESGPTQGSLNEETRESLEFHHLREYNAGGECETIQEH